MTGIIAVDPECKGSEALLSPVNPFVGIERRDAVDCLLSTLSRRARWILRLHYLRGYSPRRIGRTFHISGERAMQIERQAIAHLRQRADVLNHPEWFI